MGKRQARWRWSHGYARLPARCWQEAPGVLGTVDPAHGGVHPAAAAGEDAEEQVACAAR